MIGLAAGDRADERAIADAGLDTTSARVDDIERALEALDRDPGSVTLSGGQASVVISSGHLQNAYAEIRGWASSKVPGGRDDDHARPIRRALAHGRLKAADVGYARLATGAAEIARRRAQAIFSRALGPYAARVALDVRDDGGDPSGAREMIACVIAVAVGWPPAVDRLAAGESDMTSVTSEIQATLQGRNPRVSLLVRFPGGGQATALAFTAPR